MHYIIKFTQTLESSVATSEIVGGWAVFPWSTELFNKEGDLMVLSIWSGAHLVKQYYRYKYDSN